MQIKITVTDKEHAALKASAAAKGITLSHYAHDLLFPAVADEFTGKRGSGRKHRLYFYCSQGQYDLLSTKASEKGISVSAYVVLLLSSKIDTPTPDEKGMTLGLALQELLTINQSIKALENINEKIENGTIPKDESLTKSLEYTRALSQNLSDFLRKAIAKDMKKL